MAPLPPAFARLTAALCPTELERYRALAEDTAICMTQTCFHLRPGLSEQAVAGMLAGCLYGLGIAPVRLCVGVDDRAERLDDPIPTAARLRERVRLSLQARRHGLHVLLARRVQFSTPDVSPTDPFALRAPQEGAGAGVGALPLRRTLLGYTPRQLREGELVHADRVIACRAGRGYEQIEESYLTTAPGLELLSATPDLPSARVQVGEQTMVVSGILHR